MQDFNSPTQTTPLRVSQKTVCQMLDLTAEGLRKLILKDPSFPRKIKIGTLRQSPAYFDYAELVQWHNNQKQVNETQSV
ncbi:transcriptional regulator [Acinetobacter bereziniae]|uniref:transcriptional regulator n=1 Tax=Acinetobacter bereziniae TaxID=106648 RepID=UPI001905B61C|nr:transcriptional regulator [Acinetobacter bereziniae]MDG3555846.1 transcriptional regulator [Acinetobacter bereziniae]MDP5999797.1 transcriptional regulator [Acinetobacter bereziniae]QQC81231.1 transcriptional regulator [Acinetobacter bereziniae]UUN94336.1 transcriptional regulator [Acinetobacter bereziniae]WMW75401.1 transcriptional regulator [Acinetobacter bereziniae]